MIKKIILVILFILLSFYLSSGAQKNLGIGIIVGAPTGISVKYYIDKDKAFDAGVGWSLKKNYMRIHGDYLFHNYKLLKKMVDFPLVLYYGGGVKCLFADEFELGVRIPVGVLYNIKKPSFDLFCELVPGLDLLPETDFGFDAAIGARYYFDLK